MSLLVSWLIIFWFSAEKTHAQNYFVATPPIPNQNNTILVQGDQGYLSPSTVCIPNSNPYGFVVSQATGYNWVVLTFPLNRPAILNPDVCFGDLPPIQSGSCQIFPNDQVSFAFQPNTPYLIKNSGVAGTNIRSWVSVAGYTMSSFGCGYGLSTDMYGNLNPPNLCIPNSNPFTTWQTMDAQASYILVTFLTSTPIILNPSVCQPLTINSCTLQNGDPLFLQFQPNTVYQVQQSGAPPIRTMTSTIMVSDNYGTLPIACPVTNTPYKPYFFF